MTTIAKLIEGFEENFEVKLPKHKVVCDRCHGEGKHVNPNIDSNGLTREDFDADPDFFDDYMRGVYDVTCHECGGKNVVDEVETEAMDPELRKEWEAWLASDAETEAISAMERRMGA